MTVNAVDMQGCQSATTEDGQIARKIGDNERTRLR